jgi:hypothetical protein
MYAAHGISMPPAERQAEMRKLHGNDGVVRQFAAQAEIGRPGTRVIDGRIDVERNARLKPYFARGRTARPGIIEDVYRSEPVVFNSLNSITALVCNATYEPVIPASADDELRAIVQRAHRSILYQRDGFAQFLRNASTAFKLGFAPFELVWDDGYISAIAFREQSTVERWLFDARQTRLVGAQFQSWDVNTYVLPCGAETPAGERLGVVNINATGNNVEGVSPVRVVVGLRKLKELILSVWGVSYQKYGVPIALVMRELVDASAASLAAVGGAESVAETQSLVNRLVSMSSATGPVLPVPTGVRVDYATPTGSMPDPRPMLEYIDQLMALVMSNEGAMLGTSSFGSYALASVADNRFMRAAPVYAGAVSEFLTRLLRMMIRWNHSTPDSIEEWPEYSFRFAGTQDASRWAADMQVLVSSQVWTWPEQARRMAAANMGLSVEAFDNWAAQTSPDVSGQQEVSNGLD